MMRFIRVLFFLLLFYCDNIFAQNEPPQAGVWVCVRNGNAYYDWLGTSTDVGGPWPSSGTRYYNFNPTGRRINNFDSSAAYDCYSFTAGSPANESCRVSGNNGTRGYFLYSLTYCPLDKNIYYLIAATIVTVLCVRTKKVIKYNA